MEDDGFDPVIARLECGQLAKQFRESARVEVMDAEREIGGYTGKLSKIENGRIAPKPDDVEKLIKLYRLTSQQADDLRQRATQARRRAQPAKAGGATSRQYISLERAADEIRMVYNEIPGLLQTREFAHAALSRSPTVSAGDVNGLAEAREERGKRLIRPDGSHMWIVLGIDALTRVVGNRDVLRRQLEHLREVSQMPNVRFRVLSADAGAIPALSCPFTLLYVNDGRTIAFVASLTRTDYIKATAVYTSAFETAWALAESEADSAVILEDRITDLT